VGLTPEPPRPPIGPGVRASALVLRLPAVKRSILATLLATSLAVGCVSLDNLAGGPDDITAPARDDGGVDAPDDAPAGAICGGVACGPHSKCDDTTGACACVTGYAREGAMCVWHGGPLDPGFTGDPAGAWQMENGAVLDAGAEGGLEPGTAVLGAQAACDSKATIRQSFKMPTLAEGEPYALDVSLRSGGFGFPLPSLGGTISRGYLTLPDLSFGGSRAFVHASVCLGERAYGDGVELAFHPIDPYGGCFGPPMPDTEIDLDHAGIITAASVPQAECPAPGTVPNGDFEGTGVWTVSGNAEVMAGAGSMGSRAGHVWTTTFCQGPTLTGTMSPPFLSMAKPSLTFSFKGTNGQQMRVTSGGYLLGVVNGTATFEAGHFCVPDWAKGMVNKLAFGLSDPGGTCANPNVRDFVFDDVGFATDATCPTDAYVRDPGFEDTGVSSPWLFAHSTQYTTNATILSGTGAHTGSAYLMLSVGQVCASATARQTISLPPPSGSAGPAIKLWYRLPTVSKASFSVSPAGGALTASTTWTQKIICMPPSSIGPVELYISGNGGGGTCANTYGTETLYVDDVEATTDPSCPAQ
jgi:hypothetical protein